ncbi:acyl-CoA synthetase [Photobacterium gaetbulicola Gung47]|uniref:Acyl-CoA synthetase n=1 Tax=Photobacterium gaetbulicola Gung47 TaxID=658445 RepID=A0A0C5W368_9GAMM|nr:AMP-binding protein [Photobacterium gaetbulicola]AJR05816.1 acyl-CoA synthetase [Photobacterium gaetbulicola Gung47]
MMDRTKKSYFHRGALEPLLGNTIPEHFNDIARKYSQRDAVVSIHQRRRLSYFELSEEVDKLAKGLIGSGFKKGDRIGIWSTDNIEWLLLQMATARIGCILVNINPAYRQHELAYALQCSEVQGLFVIPSFRGSNYISMLMVLLPELNRHSLYLSSKAFPHLHSVVVFDPESSEKTSRPANGFRVWLDILDKGKHISDQALNEVTDSLDCDDAINIQYTSGTTGFPKAVVLSHHNILNNAYFAAKSMHFCEQDRLCVPVPFYHCFGMVLANLLCLSVGACIVIPSEHFDPEDVLRAIETEKCTAIHGVPTMFIAELEHEKFDCYDLSSLRTGIMAGAPCPMPLMMRVMNDMHCHEILIGYGETEASPLTHLTAREDTLERRTQTVGQSLPHQEVKVVAIESGRTLALGEIGEICFRGYHIMKGYYANVEGTKEAIDEQGWLHSGDLGTMDVDGYVRITGRIKELIIRGGENIYPREVEDLLFSHPKVQQAAVFGIPDEFYGEEVVAWVQLHENESMTEEEVRNYCRDQITHFKVPRYIRFVHSFPMTVTGKFQKFEMREKEIEKYRKK